MMKAPIVRGVSILTAAFALLGAVPKGMDPVNPTCPLTPNWSDAPTMKFTVRNLGDDLVLLAEGAVDAGATARLDKILTQYPDVGEIWFRSPGGDAQEGNKAGLLLRRKYKGMLTRVPKGWACFSACNFIFMGGTTRIVEPGGQFIVHMFTHVADRENVKGEIEGDLDGAVDMIGDIEQSSAILASEDNDFLIRMGVSRLLLTEVMYQQKAVAARGKDRSTRRCLTQAELARYTVINAREE